MKFLLRERLKSVSAIESRYGSSLRPLHPIAAVNASASMPYVIAVVAISGRLREAGPRPDESACDVGCKPRNNVANQHERGVYLPRKCPYQPRLKLLAKVEDTQAKPAKKPRSLAHSRHKMSLTTVGGLPNEQTRIYRMSINSRITAELATK